MAEVDPLIKKLLTHYGYPTLGSQHDLLNNTLAAFSRIPYENITKIIASRQSPGLRRKESPAEIINNHIMVGSGGTCFALTETLLYLIRSLGYEAHSILADRRYGSDTHCALIAKLNDWHLIDPGYLIHSPCRIPASGVARYEQTFNAIELKVEQAPERISLSTLNLDQSGELTYRYRLTYKTSPVDTAQFYAAWDRSFDWDMMGYPIISTISGDSQIYLQKRTLSIRSRENSTRIQLSDTDKIKEIALRSGISMDLIKRALTV